MLRILPFILLLSFSLTGYGQSESRLPADLRQHNLTTYNASLFNPAFSLSRNNPQSLAFWTRWQWQDIDSDPTTIFVNYTRKLNSKSAVGAAFFQHNTGVFFNTGGAINYARQLKLNKMVKLAFGLNVFAFKQTLADDRFQPDPNVPLPLPTVSDDFILQMAPGISLEVERLTLSLASENLFDYNFTASESNSEKEDKIFMSLLSYDFPISLGSASNAFLRPSMYLRTIPGESNQVGFYTLLNSNEYWGQVGYNNFYGYAVGLGGTFFKHLSLGALVELGTGSSVSKDPSFELMAAYFLGKPNERHKVVGFDLEEEENELLALEEQEKLEKVEEEVASEDKEDERAEAKKIKEEEKLQRRREKIVQDSIAKIEKEAALAEREEQKRLDKEIKAQEKQEEALAKAQEKESEDVRQPAIESDKTKAAAEAQRKQALVEAQEAAQKRKQDSLIEVAQEAKRKEAIAAKEKAEKAQAEIAAQVEADKPKEGEKYEEVRTEDGLKPGYYLIANVFGTKKYFDAFMSELRKKGLTPESFLRSKNNYNYAYLERFDTMQEARKARDSNYDGKYPGKTWIFRVVSE